ncbi:MULTISPECIES: sensor histidine kinase [Psychrilyobacter]|uniref:histidine kinase n=1 Tax=Psychrilyobacter piezotolerans TaxID=2293438 RepID=A0ABX9KKP0_9FUSO|nr:MULTISPECIES: HAMP domain-containing sensor histidine kinase [Psychrilyobacter]MCS5421061.1 HAMP domain-containing histidine kinase [Psychrilyobacter sp. S5]NDI76340.1 HAMP domain-containing histidine kinase [Psychrilyobacter piezotolerans]RDE65938.1 sensor histidine kinase [Psychrilyobacter sp. S5]REI43116.1 sensor histidine kinase [Psychrilyobacter piezotolerans]
MTRSKIKIFKSYLLLLGGSLIPLFLFISFFYQFNISQNIEKMKSEKKMILNLIKKDIEREFVDYIDDVRFLSETPQLRSLLYRRSNLKENQDYLKSYLKIKSKYFAGYVRNNRNHVVIEEYHNNGYIKFPEQFLTKNPKKITFSKLGKYKNNFIVNITAPIYGENDAPLGTISLYGKQGWIDGILEKYRSINLIADGDFYWLSLDNNNKIDEFQKTEILKQGNFLPINSNSGSVLSKDVLFTFDTIDFKELFPQLDFSENTESTWRLIVKVPETEIIAMKKHFLDGYRLLSLFIFFFLSIIIWVILKETNKRKFYENKLESQNQKLIENNRTKDKFISILAHDLKSPFTGITGIFNILTRKYDFYDETKKKKLIYSINDSIQGINALLINLLEWSKIQRGHVIPSPIKVKINDLTGSAYQVLKLNLESKNIKFSNNISDKHFIWADKNMIDAVFRNILSNAIKFTPNSGKIELYSERKDKFILIYIKDNGVGMNLDIQSKLFKLDQHLTTLGTENEKGTGLGLIITKEFIHLNRGSLEVDSIKDQGTTFIIKLPAYREI